MIVTATGRIAITAALVTTPACTEHAPPEPEPAKIAEAQREDVDALPDEIRLHNGFLPDPTVIEDSMTGTFDASEWDSSCQGYIDPDEAHVLVTEDAFAELRVLAWAETEAALIIRDSEDRLHCTPAFANESTLASSLRAGHHSVWIATSTRDREVHYRLGFSELRTTSVASLSHP